MISYNVHLFYRISPHCVIQSRDIYTRIYTHISLYAYRICAVSVAEREIGALSYPFPGSHARCSSQFHFDPSLHANSTRCYARVVSARENLVARRAALAWRGCDRVSRNFYWTIFVPCDSRHCLRKLCAATRFQKVNRAYRQEEIRAFGFSYYSIKSDSEIWFILNWFK